MSTPCRESVATSGKPMIIGIFASAMFMLAGQAVVPGATEARDAVPADLGLGPKPAVRTPQSPLQLSDWMDAHGDPLPFETLEEVEEFLRSAEVVERDNLDIGVTDPIRVKLAQDGIEVHAVFRYLDTTYNSVRMQDGRVRMNLRDSCHFEPAAYELSRLLGMSTVPPAVSRRIGTDNGSLQLWIYDAVMESQRREEGMQSPNRLDWIRQVHEMYLFDALIGNDDRTQQNILIDEHWKLWLIDHTRAFYPRAESPNLGKATFVARDFWERLQALDEPALTAALDAHLTGAEIEQTLERRDRVAAHVAELIATRGEGAVLYER